MEFCVLGPCATTHVESGGFCRSRPGVEHPDIMFHFVPTQVIDHGRKNPTEEAYQVHVGPMRQESRGWLKLRSSDPREHPVINPNYLSTGKNENDAEKNSKLYVVQRIAFALTVFMRSANTIIAEVTSKAIRYHIYHTTISSHNSTN